MSSTTPEERQEIAEKLREAGRELDGEGTSSIRSAFCAIDRIIGTQGTGRTFEPFFNRPADLMTIHVTWSQITLVHLVTTHSGLRAINTGMTQTSLRIIVLTAVQGW